MRIGGTRVGPRHDTLFDATGENVVQSKINGAVVATIERDPTTRQVVRSVDAAGNERRFAYEHGFVSEEWRNGKLVFLGSPNEFGDYSTMQLADGRLVTQQHNARGQVVGSHSESQSESSTWVAGLLQSVTDLTLGLTTTLGRDAAGNVTSTTGPGHSQTVVLDPAGRALSGQTCLHGLCRPVTIGTRNARGVPDRYSDWNGFGYWNRPEVPTYPAP
jgi:hypothetical protein